ncbi:3-dehydroquinate synthase [Cytophagaceae bacterium DM2B3-1]|uniref:3-dehydroquinate synthase n=1 Tax=Xanthocytophaga flava TaxID=3048013 RepID=A0AAE3U7E7_9BACT|nr:3-dehydroquinate synthase [Xanthocytophaga flavus]MDJ1481532.1 3-dehydroquinate synthase [Xanthocytophaga flavus]MDJ1491511.1 3-dehydroquinate synthase [Xanthocytophaga flavus]
MQSLYQQFQVRFQYPVHFTNGLFKLDNPLFAQTIQPSYPGAIGKVLFVIDSGVALAYPQLEEQIQTYAEANRTIFQLAGSPIFVEGGEACKNTTEWVEKIEQAVNEFGIDRHSYIAVIGGGAVLDMAGFAAAVSHRGVRLIRIPTTVLAQNDSGIGVKNSVNAFNKKNFLGTFAPPFAVLNDFDFLAALQDRDWRSGIAEAVKVALIKDSAFFSFLFENASALATRDLPAMQQLIHRCAELHLNHIAGGDPFEMGSSRPLDFGHWSAHKLEALNGYQIRHGEAVAIGIALDSIYSQLVGKLSAEESDQILELLEQLGFELYIPELSARTSTGELAVIRGLHEFREHLGGRLTIMLLERIGKGVEVHEINTELMTKAIGILETRKQKTEVNI